ncbi:MAG TPA: NAD(P)-binding domain-containing protein [Pseudomonadota bacterium]|nr:NAD(P)-binding domain-containing protein [Pseudomonadota bacterium]
MLTFSLAMMAILGPAALIARARAKQRAQEAARALLVEKPVLWNFSVNESLCIGCDKCVHTCPQKVLELDPHKQVMRVARESDCVQCRACDKICPTGALKMYRSDGPAPTIEFPDLDEFYQPVGRPGLYLVGEPAGLPRIKNAINLGQAAVEHMVSTGLKPAPRPKERSLRWSAGASGADAAGERSVDVLIVGAGPAGLSAAIACTQHGLSYALLEQGASPLNTIVRFPKGKTVHALPRELGCDSPLSFDECTKEELIERWQDVKAEHRIREQTQVTVTDIQPQAGGYRVETDRCGRYLAQRVVVAIGGFGQPKPLPKVDMAEQLQPHVFRSLDNPDEVRGKNVVVVGGSDSAVEAALALCRPELGNAVFLVYYKNKKFLGANKKNLELLFAAESRKEVYILDQAEVNSISQATLSVQRKQRAITLRADAVYVLIGSSPSRQFLQKIGIVQKRFDHGRFSREASDALLRRLRPVRKAAPNPGAERDAHARGEHLRSTAGSFLDTCFEPAQEARIADEHERLQRSPTPSRPPRLVVGNELENPPPPSPHRAALYETVLDPAAGPHPRLSGLGPTRAAADPPRTEKLTLADIGERTTQAKTPPLSQASTLRLPGRGDESVYRTIRIPTEYRLMRNPEKAVIPDNAPTRAELKRLTLESGT